MITKRDGSIRFCCDFRKLNDCTVKDSQPLPRIDDSLDALSGSKWFSTMDMKSGFWQVKMAKEDRPKTAFSIYGSGVWQFTVMPFGLCNSPATFERLMERVLAGLSWNICLIYLDDIIVYSKTFEGQLGNLDKVLTKLAEANLKLNPKKCHFFKKEVGFLGHVVNEHGISTDPEKIQSVKNWPVPRNVKDLRSFLGLCSYYRKFVKDFATVAKPLHDLTKKDCQYVWSAQCQEAFKKLKESLISAPILSYPTETDLFVLDTDASGVGVGVVLSQVQNGQEKVISYFSNSKCLSKPERKYCVTRRELLAIVYAVKTFHHFLYGRHFLIRTDHGALRWIMNFKRPGGSDS